MELLKQLLPALITVSLGLMMVAAGMASSRGDFVYVLRRPRDLFRAFLAISVVPLIGAMIVLALFSEIPRTAQAAILLLAISPVPPLVPGKALKAGSSASYVYGLQAVGAVLAVVMVPILGDFLASYYDLNAQFPVKVAASNIFIGVLVPLAIGIGLGRWLFPHASPKWPRLINMIAMVLVLVALLPILIAIWPKMRGFIGDGTVVAMIVVVAIALAGGHLLGGPELPKRAAFAFAASTRHPGIALALAGANNLNKDVTGAVVLFLLVCLIVQIPYQVMLRRRKADMAPLPAPADQL